MAHPRLWSSIQSSNNLKNLLKLVSKGRIFTSLNLIVTILLLAKARLPPVLDNTRNDGHQQLEYEREDLGKWFMVELFIRYLLKWRDSLTGNSVEKQSIRRHNLRKLKKTKQHVPTVVLGEIQVTREKKRLFTNFLYEVIWKFLFSYTALNDDTDWLMVLVNSNKAPKTSMIIKTSKRYPLRWVWSN